MAVSAHQNMESHGVNFVRGTQNRYITHAYDVCNHASLEKQNRASGEWKKKALNLKIAMPRWRRCKKRKKKM